MTGYKCDGCGKFIPTIEGPFCKVRTSDYTIAVREISQGLKLMGYWADFCEDCWYDKVRKAIEGVCVT